MGAGPQNSSERRHRAARRTLVVATAFTALTVAFAGNAGADPVAAAPACSPIRVEGLLANLTDAVAPGLELPVPCQDAVGVGYVGSADLTAGAVGAAVVAGLGSLALATADWSSIDFDNNGPNNTGSYNTGSANTGSDNVGWANTGSANVGSANTGSGNVGSANTGSGNVGSANTGSVNLGSMNTGSATYGSMKTGIGSLAAGSLGIGTLS